MALFQVHFLPVLLAAFLLCFSSEAVTDSSTSPCRPSELHSPQCLSAVQTLMADESRYWFGTNYSLVCGFPNSYFLSTCVNAAPQRLSIVTRMRGSNDSSVDVIQQVLNVTFDVPAGSYPSCGNTYRVPAITLTINPLETSAISLWSANHVPKVTWRAEANQLYTLIMWDSGSVYMHNMVVNINGSDAQDGTIIYKYRGPKNSANRDQPYVFLLFKQAGELNDTQVQEFFIAALSTPTRNVAPQTFVDNFALTGPIGVSVLTVRTDPFSAEYMKQSRIINNCPAMLTPKFSALPLSYDVSGARLKTSVDVTFMSPEASFRSCCKDVSLASNTRVANPMGDGLIQPVYTRYAPHITLVPSNFFDTFYFLRIDFTLLLLDVTDELSGNAGASSSNTLLHWQVINILEGEVTSGETTMPYQAPLPLTVGGGRGGGQRVFLFLLLKQSATVHSSSDLTRFTGGNSCPPHVKNRCRFNLTSFVMEHGMTVEGASWFMSSPDDYSRKQVVMQRLQDEQAACRDVRGYDDPCPSTTCTGGSEVTHASFVGVVLTSAFLIISRAMFC